MMPACTMPGTPPTKKDFEYFQRKKVGSIRDNPKLMKIRQRFENACQDDSHTDSSKFSYSDSAPHSMTLSSRTASNVLEELLGANLVFSDKTDTFRRSQSDIRRHSEGETGSQSSLSIFVSHRNKLDSSSPSNIDANESDKFTRSSLQKAENSALSKPGNKVIATATSEKPEGHKINWNTPLSKEGSISAIQKTSHKVENTVQIFEKFDISAPPIPKRGISPAVRKSMISPLSLNPSQNCLPPSKEVSPNRSKSSPVKKTIQMYEGMLSDDVRKVSKYSATSHKSFKKEISSANLKSSGLCRRSSRRNSFKKSRCVVDTKASKTNNVDERVKNERSCSKEDSGLGSSDTEDKTQPVYQTLSTVVQEHDDPYDRLNRIHDVIARVHKGQISSCAACKTLPPSISQWPAEENSILHVKCHEASPHHHPPCICFSCSHSVFTCSLDIDVPPPDISQDGSSDIEQDTLYSNVCCLNSPDHEGWRQSRRRPICERNGRLCVVNCDMEQRQMEPYDRLCDWNSVSSNDTLTRQRQASKPVSADSCDSDEGWVDVTDSEDEKIVTSTERIPSLQSENADTDLYRNIDQFLAEQNSSYHVDTLLPKCASLDLSRCSSTEHLYETIADVESHNANSIIKESPDDSSTLSLKSEQNLENDLDSGEWSTESTSPTFNESTSKDQLLMKQSESYQNRFSIQLESQETAKLNFMKSVLGKKGPNTKQRMSNFFVPWFVMNEYNAVPPRNHKTVTKKKSGCYPMSSKTSPRKAKRSQSTPTNSPVTSRASNISYNSVDSLDKLKNKESKTGNTSIKFLDTLCLPSDLSSRASVASSAYLRVDEVQTPKVAKERSVPSSDAPPVEVSVEHVYRKSSSGAEHNYILFQPVKEEEVPLYQFYERNVKERVSFCCSTNSLSPVSGSSSFDGTSSSDSGMKQLQLSVVEQLSPDAQDMKMLWCELPEVKESGILERISAQELKLQEAAFEFIQSQASFIRSLKVLYENFVCIPEFSDSNSSSCVLSKHEHDVLFSDIVRVKEVGENLLSELTARWSDAILIPDICDIIHQHASSSSFSVYIRYCSNRVYQERTLKELKETRLCFLEVLHKLESNPVCQGLSLESFLFLPMQHIARLPLLLDNMFRWLTSESPSYSTCKLALESVHKIFMECNEGARKMERLEEMFVLNKQLEFKECKALPLISASRWLLKKGELLKLEFDKKTFGRSSRCVRVPIFIFLFNDLLVVTKRKSEDCYLVVDYCSRDKVQAMAINARDLQHPMVVPNTCRYLIYLTLFNNHQGSAVDMILSCTLLSERTRWIEAIHSVLENKPCEVWEYDCPQVQCVRSYIAQQPDEISLQESDVITIHRKMNDGWYEGRRLRDGLQGWFPASYTMDIPCSRARASNLRQCYRLLMLSHKQ